MRHYLDWRQHSIWTTLHCYDIWVTLQIVGHNVTSSIHSSLGIVTPQLPWRQLETYGHIGWDTTLLYSNTGLPSPLSVPTRYVYMYEWPRQLFNFYVTMTVWHHGDSVICTTETCNLYCSGAARTCRILYMYNVHQTPKILHCTHNWLISDLFALWIMIYCNINYLQKHNKDIKCLSCH
jgi:hypothetical protein